MDQAGIAARIRELRKKNQLSQEGFAERLGVSRQTVSKWELAEATPELDKILLLSEQFRISTDYLLTGGERYRKRGWLQRNRLFEKREPVTFERKIAFFLLFLGVSGAFLLPLAAEMWAMLNHVTRYGHNWSIISFLSRPPLVWLVRLLAVYVVAGIFLLIPRSAFRANDTEAKGEDTNKGD